MEATRLSGAVNLAKPTDGDDVHLARCRAGEREAFGILLNRYRDSIINLAYQILHNHDDAEDAAQEAFVRAFSKLHSFRGEARFLTWLYRITINICLHRRRGRTHESYAETAEVSDADVEAQVTRKIMLEDALDNLPGPLRLTLILHELHGLSYQQIASILDIPAGTVGSRLNEARRRVRIAWDAE